MKKGREKHLPGGAEAVVMFLQSMASPCPRGSVPMTVVGKLGRPEIRRAESWHAQPEASKEDHVHCITEGAGKYNTDRLFWLLWACARLDINIFLEPFTCGRTLLDNLENNEENNVALRAKQEKDVSAQHFPKVIWALAIFLRKYADGKPELKTKIIGHINRRLAVLAKKIGDEKIYGSYLVHLQQTQYLLRPFSEKIQWPKQVADVIAANDFKNDEKPSQFEGAVFHKLKHVYPDIKFDRSYKIREIDHIVDIAILDKKIAIEVDGPGHYYLKSERIDTKTWARDQMLKDLGWTVVRISYLDWQRATETSTDSGDAWVTPAAAKIAQDALLREKLNAVLGVGAQAAEGAASEETGQRRRRRRGKMRAVKVADSGDEQPVDSRYSSRTKYVACTGFGMFAAAAAAVASAMRMPTDDGETLHQSPRV